MFRLIKKVFITLLITCTTGLFDGSLASNSKGHIKCVSSNKQPCQARPTLVDIISDEILFYPFIVSFNKCVVEVVTLLMIHMLEYVFQIKPKI